MTFKPLLICGLLLGLGLVEPASAFVTSKQVLSCLNHPQIELIGQVENLKAAGVSKAELSKNLNPGLTPQEVVLARKILDYVYDKKHEVAPSISALVSCLNQEVKEGSTLI